MNEISNKSPQHKKKEVVSRSHSIEYVSQHTRCPFTCVKWYDNKEVSLLSIFVGQESKLTTTRYNGKIRDLETVSLPRIVKHYDLHMGGGINLMQQWHEYVFLCVRVSGMCASFTTFL